MDTEQYERLLDIQSEWEIVTGKHCQWEADFFTDGSIRSMWLAGCLARHYHQRIDALRLNLCEGIGMTGECDEALKYKE
jgi:hypothetical protein